MRHMSVKIEMLALQGGVDALISIGAEVYVFMKAHCNVYQEIIITEPNLYLA